MDKLVTKRIFAYILDVIFISFILSLVMQISFINPNYDNYFEIYEEHTADRSISELTEYMETSLYEENVYLLAGYGSVYFILDIVVLFGYFVLFQKYNNGQTIGKKLMKIKIVGEDKKDLKLSTLFIRSLFLYEFIPNLIKYILVLFTMISFSTYNFIDLIIVNVFSIIFWVCAIMIVFTSKHKGLHEIVSKTKVISVKESKKSTV